MSRQPDPIELSLPPGVLSNETDRGTKGRYKLCDKIRFRDGMPEKLGGWALASFGSSEGEQVEFEYESNTTPNPSDRVRYANTTYGAGAASILLGSSIGASVEGTIHDGDPVWLFDDSLVGGMGGRTLTGVLNSYTATASANITASLGDAVFIRYPAEYAGIFGATIVAGNAIGSAQLTLGTAVTKYLKAGSIVRITLAGGSDFYTRLENNILSGATLIDIENPLPTLAKDALAGGAVMIYPAGSHIIRNEAGNFVAYVIRFLANPVAASTALIFTRQLPAAATALQIDVRPFQETFANGDHFDGIGLITTINIAPNTAFAIVSGANTTISNALVFFPEFEEIQTRYLGEARAVEDWKDLDDQQWSAIGTDKKLYVVNNGELFDITPVRSTAILVDPFATTVASQTVVVTDVAHGAQAGDYVRYSGAAVVGGLDMNDEFEITTVVDADHYTVTHGQFATSTVAAGGGVVNVEYDISAGLESSDEVEGWGTGSYGGGAFGIGQAGVGVQQKLRIWSLANFGEDLLASPSGGALYHWDRSSGPTTRAVVVPNAPATIQRMLVSPQARIVIAMGAGTGSYTSPGPPDSLFIRWSDSEDFSTWIPTTTNAAGDIRLDKGSEIITAVESRGDIIANTDKSLHALQYIGGELTFGLRHLGQSVSIIGPNAEADVNGIVHFMSERDFIIFDGVIRVLPCDVHDTVFKDFNVSQGYKVFCAVVRTFNEVWWFYPSALSSEPDRYVKFNYLLQVWDFGTMDRTAFHDTSRFLNKPYGLNDGLMWQHETGVDETDEEGILRPMISYIESGDIEVDDGGSRKMHIHAMIPDFKKLIGTAQLRINGKPDPQDNARKITRGPFVLTSATPRIPGMRMKAREISFELRTTNLGDEWRMGKWKVEAAAKGKRG